MGLAGFPAMIVMGATSLVTTLPAPITAPSPMVTPGSITTFDAIHTLSLMTTGLAFMMPVLRFSASLACVIVQIVVFGPMNT